LTRNFEERKRGYRENEVPDNNGENGPDNAHY